MDSAEVRTYELKGRTKQSKQNKTKKQEKNKLLEICRII